MFPSPLFVVYDHACLFSLDHMRYIHAIAIMGTPTFSPALLLKPLQTLLTHNHQEFNARTAHYTPGTPIPARVTVRPDRTFHFEIRTPPTATLLLAAAGVMPSKSKIKGAGNVPGPTNNIEGAKGKQTSSSPTVGNAVVGTVGSVSLKHVFEIAKIKQTEVRLSGMSTESLAKCIVAQAASIGVVVVP
jgi:large subunit ribosomal protein L11